jgi:hypothetical protein
MTLEELLEALRRDVPEVHDLLRAHLAYLPGGDEFVLMGLLRERALELFDEERSGALHRLLEIVDEALADGDDELADAVSGDFIAATQPWDPEMDHFVATWPVQMRAQAVIETARSQDP